MFHETTAMDTVGSLAEADWVPRGPSLGMACSLSTVAEAEPVPMTLRRLLFVVHDLHARGGMEIQLAHLVKGLAAEASATVASITSSPNPIADQPFADAGVYVAHLGAVGPRMKAGRLGVLTRLARRAEVVHCTDWDASLWGRLAAMAARRPVVVTHHSLMRDLMLSRNGASRRELVKWHNRLLDRFTAATVVCARSQIPVLRDDGVNLDRVLHIPNGVPVRDLRAQAGRGRTRRQLGIPEEAKVLAHVGRVMPSKGQFLTLDTVDALRRKLGDVRVVFAGTGPDLPRLRERIAETGADWATVLGFEPNVGSVLALADLAVLPSRAEAMPMAVLEALAVGTPLVATDVGDVRAVLDQTGGGLTVAADREDDYARACWAVLSSNELASRLSESARASAPVIDAATMIARYAELFERIHRESSGR